MTDNNTERDAFIELLNVYDSTMRNLLTLKSIRTQEQKDRARLAIIEAFEARATSPAPNGDSASGTLQVWYGPMPESNGKSNFTAILNRGDIVEGITIAQSEYPDRVRYEADRMRWMIGELAQEPDILDYDENKHSGYVEPDSASDALPVGELDAELRKLITRLSVTAKHSMLQGDRETASDAARTIARLGDAIAATAKPAKDSSDALPARNAGLTLPSADAIYAELKGVAVTRTSPENICDVLAIIKRLAAPEASNWQERVQLRMMAKPEHDEPGVIGGACAAPEALPEAAPVATDCVMLSYELDGVLIDAENARFDEVSVKTITRVRDALRNTPAAPASEPIARDVLTKLDAAFTYPSGQLKVCSSIEDGKTVFVVVRTIPLESILITDLGKSFASWSLAEAARLKLVGALPSGTFACPICGKDSPHEHSSAEVAQHRIDQRVILEAAREGKS